MARVTVDSPTPSIKGADLHVVADEPTVAKFAAYVSTSRLKPGGDMNLTLGVLFDQIPNAMPLIEYVQGVVFEVTVRRVPMDQLPEAGW